MKFKNKKTGEIVEWGAVCIDAALVSAQRRRRLFWTNIPGVTLPQDRGILLKDILEGGAGDKHEWDSVYQYRRTYWRETTGGKVPTLTANMGTGGNNVPYIKVLEATKKGYAIATPGMSVDMSFPNSKTRRGRVGNKAKNLMTSGTAIHAFTQGQVRKLTPIECERLQSLPDNYTEGVSNTQRYRACGNAFNVEVVRHILNTMYERA